MHEHGSWVKPENMSTEALQGVAAGARNAAAQNAARSGDLAERCRKIAERAAERVAAELAQR